MKKIFSIVILVFICSCNTTTDNREHKDSSVIAHNSVKDLHHDTVEATPPAIPSFSPAAKIYFKNLENGQTLTSPLTVKMGATGIRVDSAGIVKQGSGHHLLLIDVADTIPKGLITQQDSTHLHFSNGERETVIKLSRGVHKLTLQFVDGMHRSYGSKLSTSIMVTVK